MTDVLLIASNNVDKQVEFEYLLRDLPIKLIYPADLELNLEVEESGSSYYENALLKASAFFTASGVPTLADDSGLEVYALSGEPGIHSHRYARLPNASDADRRSYLLEQLAPHPRPWLACFHCVIVMIDAQGDSHHYHGSCHGEIIPKERGEGGFGYDPIFFMPALNATMAELPESLKNAVSHRANAVKAALPHLKALLINGSG